MAFPRPCLVCGTPAQGGRCSLHKRRRPGYTNAERIRRKAVVDEHRAAVGTWCPGYGVPAHRSNDLTADHVIPVGAGGAETGPLRVLCRSCNARKRDRV